MISERLDVRICRAARMLLSVPALCTVRAVTIELRALTRADAEAHCAGEDEQTVRWLTGGYGTVEGTAAYFEWLAGNAAAGRGKRGFGVWLDGHLAGYVDCDPDVGDGLKAGDVNVSYAVHPWARGRGVAVEAVQLICAYVRANQIGRRAAIRVDPENEASVRVARKCGFTYMRDFVSTTDTHHDVTPVTFSLYLVEL
jgi:RimJ/RimL family protein N-acetyltransferase